MLLGIVFLTRLGTYLPLPGVDREAFSQALQGSGASGVLGYVDTLSGGSISKVGVFSLGIVPYINASIIMQLLTSVFPELKKMQRDEGPAGRRRFSLYQKVAALVFAVAQAVGQLNYIRPFVTDFNQDVSSSALPPALLAVCLAFLTRLTHSINNSSFYISMISTKRGALVYM